MVISVEKKWGVWLVRVKALRFINLLQLIVVFKFYRIQTSILYFIHIAIYKLVHLIYSNYNPYFYFIWFKKKKTLTIYLFLFWGARIDDSFSSIYKRVVIDLSFNFKKNLLEKEWLLFILGRLVYMFRFCYFVNEFIIIKFYVK